MQSDPATPDAQLQQGGLHSKFPCYTGFSPNIGPDGNHQISIVAWMIRVNINKSGQALMLVTPQWGSTDVGSGL